MSKTSQRITKTVKSQKKSLFIQREEEATPEKLNCAHFERLVRIHTMLSLAAETQDAQIQFGLDAKFFLTQIIRLSFKTLNQMDENALRYAIIDEKSKTGGKI